MRAHQTVEGSGPLDLEAGRVLTFHPGAAGPPVVIVMTWEGEAEGVPRLVDALGGSSPIHAVVPPVGEEPRDFPRDVEAWVDHVEAALGAAGVDRAPFWIGWSFGGVVAARAAQRRWDAASQSGVRPHVVMLDSRSPTTMDKAAPTRPMHHRAVLAAASMVEMDRAQRVAYAKGGVQRISERRRRRTKRAQTTYMTPLRKSIYVAWWKYEAVPLTVEGTLLWSDSSLADVGDRFLGWGDAWDGPFNARRIGGEHFAVYEEPSLSAIADALAPVLG